MKNDNKNTRHVRFKGAARVNFYCGRISYSMACF